MRGVSSAPTERVLDTVELLTRAGNARLRFSDVVRELGLTQATGHAILKTLTDRGWVIRDPVTKEFSVGPALALVAAQVDAARPRVQAATIAARQLADELGYAASVVERIDDGLVITAFEGAGKPGAGSVSGDRIPYTPPFGVAFAAWDSTAGQQDWIDRGAATDPALAGRLVELLAQTRARGFDVDWTTPALTEAARVFDTLSTDGLPPQVRVIMDRLLVEFTSIGLLSGTGPSDSDRPVATIAAPVFDHNRHVALILGVHPLRPLSPRQIDVVGRRLTAATVALHGPLA